MLNIENNIKGLTTEETKSTDISNEISLKYVNAETTESATAVDTIFALAKDTHVVDTEYERSSHTETDIPPPNFLGKLRNSTTPVPIIYRNNSTVSPSNSTIISTPPLTPDSSTHSSSPISTTVNFSDLDILMQSNK